MFHLIFIPATLHSLCQIALSPVIVMPSFRVANSLSKSSAVTSSLPFSTQRFAVSLTTANASGKICMRTSSILSSTALVNLSIFSNNSSFSSIGVALSPTLCSRALISFSSSCFSSEINC